MRIQAAHAIGSFLLLAQFQLAAPVRGHEPEDAQRPAAKAKPTVKAALPEHAGLKPLEAAKAMGASNEPHSAARVPQTAGVNTGVQPDIMIPVDQS